MCHEWWLRHMSDEGEASRHLWDEFDHTQPLGDPEVADEQHEVTLEKREPTPLPAQQ